MPGGRAGSEKSTVSGSRPSSKTRVMRSPLFLSLRALGGTVSCQLRGNLTSYHNLDLVLDEPVGIKTNFRMRRDTGVTGVLRAVSLGLSALQPVRYGWLDADYTAGLSVANHRAAASALSSGRVLKAIAAPGAALRIALMTTSNNARPRGGKRTPAPITTQS